MSLKILFKFTTRSRRSNFLRGIDSIIDNLADKENYRIYTTFDVDDDKMRPLPEIKGNHTYIAGTSKSKIDAINRDMDFINSQYDWDILVNMSDDMVFIQKGFDDIIRKEFTDGSITNLDQYIHFNDGNQKANVSTMHIVGRDYYNRDNYIYNPEYKSLWCDVENDMVAKLRGCYKYVGDNIRLFSHLHPAFNLAPNDEQYMKTEHRDMWIADEQTFNNRKQNNFYVLTK
jgi:hypothetical protein